MVTLKEYTDVRTIHQSICTLFNDSQHNSSSHRRNVQHLKKLLLQQCSGDPVFEEQFFTSIIGCLSVLLTLKRTDETGSRLLRLLAGLIICLSGEERNEAAPRFIENVMFFCLEHIDAKDKTIRARLATLIVACMNSIDEIRQVLNEFASILLIICFYLLATNCGWCLSRKCPIDSLTKNLLFVSSQCTPCLAFKGCL